jgi:hypothetical protein
LEAAEPEEHHRVGAETEAIPFLQQLHLPGAVAVVVMQPLILLACLAAVAVVAQGLPVCHPAEVAQPIKGMLAVMVHIRQPTLIDQVAEEALEPQEAVATEWAVAAAPAWHPA